MHAHNAHQTPYEAGERRPWRILWLVAVAQFMVILDVTVVNVALPSIGEALDVAPTDLQWVVTAYVLFTGGLLLLGGRAADALGRRRMFLSGLGVFTVASLASALAPSADALILARAGQGLGAAMLSPAALSIITTTYEGRQRTTALGVWGAIGGAGAAAGVLFGGMLTSWLSWEWIFLINVPVGVTAMVLALHLVPSTAAATRAWAQLDLAGAATLVGGLVALVYAVEGTSDHGWGSSRTLVLLGASVLLLAGFAALERRVKAPLVPPRTWQIRSLVSSATMMFGATGILISAFFLNSIYLQDVMGATPLETGLAFLPFALVIGVAVHAGSHLLGHAGARPVVVSGLLLAAGGSGWLASAPGEATYVANLLPGFLLLGAGVGLIFVTVSIAAMADVDHHEAGLASGLMMTAHEIGAAIGVAVISTIAVSGISGTGGFADGYADGFIATAALSLALVVVALTAVPGGRLNLDVAPAGAH